MAVDLPREELARIIAHYGREIVADPRRCEGLLRDTCGPCDREIFILASVHKKHIPEELLAQSPSAPKELLVRRLTGKVAQELGFAEEFALWAVVSWALALSVITCEDAKAMEGKAGKRRRGEAVASPGMAIPYPPDSVIVAPAGDGNFRSIADAAKTGYAFQDEASARKLCRFHHRYRQCSPLSHLCCEDIRLTFLFHRNTGIQPDD